MTFNMSVLPQDYHIYTLHNISLVKQHQAT